jgi:hypothetical protein
MALTEAELATAKQMAVLGHSNKEIGQKLGKTTRAIREAILYDRAAGACSDCGSKISYRNTTGMCLACGNRQRAKDPAYRAKQQAGLDRKWSDPAYRAKMSAKAKAHAARLALDPAIQEVRRAAGQKTWRRLFEPEIRAKCLHAVRERSGKTQSANRIAWCPPEYREQYWFMRRTKRMTLAECKEIIADQIAREKRRELASLSPFERQERALANGAMLVANDQKPSLDRPGIYEERKLA